MKVEDKLREIRNSDDRVTEKIENIQKQLDIGAEGLIWCVP